MIAALAKRRFELGNYIVLSTVASLFMQQKVAQVGVDLFLGYPVVVLNALVLLTLNKLYVNPKHVFAIATLSVFSLISAYFASTPVTAVIAQILGISLMSVYYFSVVTSFPLSLSDWMELYSRFAFAVAIVGLLIFPLQRFEHSGESDRLHSIFVEPAFYVFLTLPAIGWYANIWLRTKQYGWDLLVFILTYALADSSLGYLGLGLVGILIGFSWLNFWKMLGTVLVGIIAFAGLLFASSNFRVRVYDTFFAISTADVSRANLSTFALLSNAYVAFQTFLDHPFLGVGVGGYQYQYQHYIGDLSGIPRDFLDLQVNMFDASSMFLRSLAELGIGGPLLLSGFLIICGQVRGRSHVEIRNAVLPFLIVRMSRYGSYFSLELFFFVAIYILNFREYRNSRRESRQIARGRQNGV